MLNQDGLMSTPSDSDPDPWDLAAARAERIAPIHPRVQAMIQAGRYQGIELDPEEYTPTAGETFPSAAGLSLWAQDAGMWSRAVRIRWRHLLRFQDSGPVVLLFDDGGAGLMTAPDPAGRFVYIADPGAPAGTPPVAVDELRLSRSGPERRCCCAPPAVWRRRTRNSI